MTSRACVCKFQDCNLIYQNPITLPCGHSLCRHHLNIFDDKFMCQFCDEEHQIPQTGYVINMTIVDLIKEYVESNPLRKEIKQTFEQLNDTILDYESIDADLFYFDHFSEVRNRVDLHREEMIDQINTKSDEIIRQLKVKEEKCKSDIAAKLEKMSLTKLKDNDIPSWIKKMRTPSANKYALNDLLTKMKDVVNKLKNESSKYNQALTISVESFQFKRYQDSSFFGELISKESEDLTNKYNRLSLQDQKRNKIANPSTDNTIKIMNIETNECSKPSKDHIDCINCVLHPNPGWLYRKYDCKYLIELIKKELSETFGVDSIKLTSPTNNNKIVGSSKSSNINFNNNDPVKFSIWLLNNIPFDSKNRNDGLKINCINQRLIFVYELLKKYTFISCNTCSTILCSKSDSFHISDMNSFLSPGKHIHGKLTCTFYFIFIQINKKVFFINFRSHCSF